MALVDACTSETTNRRSSKRGGPRAHSTYPNTVSRRVSPEVFFSVRSDTFTGSSGGTDTVRSCSSPSTAWWKCVTPAPCRITHRPESLVRPRGPGVPPQTAPASSSLRQIASPVGSEIESFANGVILFSLLLPAQLYAAPDSLSTVPKSGLARTFDHGKGVPRSP